MSTLRLAEKFFIILGLTSFPGVIFLFFSIGLLPHTFVTLLKYFIWVAVGLLLCIFWKSTIALASRNILLCILIALTFLSFIWSDFPNYTLSIGVEVLTLTLFGLYFAMRFSLKEQLQLIACTLLIGAFLSTIVALVFPAAGIHGAFEDNPGAWRGVYGQKNALGNMMVLSSLTFFALPKGNLNLYKWFGFSFSIVLMLLSNSKSSLVISFLLILIMVFYKKFRWRGKISVIFLDIGIIILACVTIGVFTYWIELLTGLGKDTTLTGRTPLWGAAIEKLMQSPLFGYGLGSFWAPKSRYAVEVGLAIETGWIPTNAHNGLLDLGLDTGLIGISLFLISYFTTLTQALKRAYVTQNSENLWALAYLCYLAMINVTESRLLSQNNLCWVLYVSLVLTLNKKSSNNKNLVKNNFKNKKYLAVTRT